MAGESPRTPAGSYTNVDANSTGTTTLFDPAEDSLITAAHYETPGSTAVVTLEATDGTNTAPLTPGQSAGNAIDYPGDIEVDAAQTLQANVTTVNSDTGVDGNATAIVFHSDY